MKLLCWVTIIILAILLADKYAVADVQTSTHPLPYPLEETRYCGEPARMADGSIRRRADVIRAFKKTHPCPVTGAATGACPGWAVDHVIPLAVGGCDSVSNLQWLPNEIKSAPGATPKDRWERRLYGSPFIKLETTQAGQPAFFMG